MMSPYGMLVDVSVWQKKTIQQISDFN
jgi:hypothetical protein